jgi:arylsulfatase A-like enzyme
LKGEKDKNWRQSIYYHYYEYPKWHHVQPHYGIRTEKYKLMHFYYDVDLWEFYDLENDPNELNNIIESEQHSELIAELKDELYAQKKEYGNTMTIDVLRDISDTNFGGLESHK